MSGKIIYHEIGRDTMFKIWHAGDMYLFLYTYSDGGSIVCSEKSYPIKKGALCLISAQKYHYTMPDVPELYDRSKLFVPPQQFKNMFKSQSVFAEQDFIYAQIPEKEQSVVDAIFKEMKDYENNELYKEMMLVSSSLKLLVYLHKYALESAAGISGVINKAVEYINKNIFWDIDIDKICSYIHISKYYFCRQFKNVMGMTVMDYILKTRIILAQNMLIKEDISVTEVSERCGFSSLSYFCRVFKQQIGKTPLQYRKQQLR